MKLLHIDSSALGANSVSRELTRSITAQWLATHPDTQVESLDLALAGLDHQESYLRTVFGFFGVTDVRFVRAEGVAMGPEAREQALKTAVTSIKAPALTAANADRAAIAA